MNQAIVYYYHQHQHQHQHRYHLQILTYPHLLHNIIQIESPSLLRKVCINTQSKVQMKIQPNNQGVIWTLVLILIGVNIWAKMLKYTSILIMANMLVLHL